MKTISLLACKRPHYLQQTLAALRKNDLTGWQIIATVDGDPENEPVIALIKAIDWIPVQLYVNKFKLGIDRASFNAVRRAFDYGAELNVYLEEDTLLSPDTLSMVQWLFQRDVVNDNPSVGVAFYREAVLYTNEFSHLIIDNSRKSDGGFGQGFACSYEQWNSFYSRYWLYFENHHGGAGWDWSISHAATDLKRKVWRPNIPRSKHIGLIGLNTNATPETCPAGTGPFYQGPIVDYILIDFDTFI